MREITTHAVNGLNEALKIFVMDTPGAGNACHEYEIACELPNTQGYNVLSIVDFQNGPIAEAGINGVSNEALLAIVRDRLEGFQSGAYACSENAYALAYVQYAMMWLKDRTAARTARGVEGTSQL